MENSTPALISTEQFNDKVRGWTISTRSRMASNAPRYIGKEAANRTDPKLAASLSYRLFKDKENISSRVKYQFPRHGVFVHYGVGRGYVRRGNAVVRTARTAGSFRRAPVDWFDVEIREGLPKLAEIAQEFYGDWALDDMLSKIEKFTIQRKI